MVTLNCREILICYKIVEKMGREKIDDVTKMGAEQL
jgi:hypothetical protein